MKKINVEITRAVGTIPTYATKYAAGADLYSVERKTILPGSRVIIDTGLKIAIPDGFEAQIRPRSGLALKDGITVLNSPGTIDADYRGPLKIILFNASTKPFIVNNGDKIAQLIISPIVQANFIEVGMLKETERGEKGFGSTGV